MAKFINTPLDGVIVVEPTVYADDRGFFFESWSASEYSAAGINLAFSQDNHSFSAAGVLRGLHYQKPSAQGQLMRVVTGAVYDVVVDLRRSSPTFGRWFGIELSARNKLMLWSPGEFAHGFLCLEDNTNFLYKCTSPYDPTCEFSIRWDDPTIGICWPLQDRQPLLSKKDDGGVWFREAQTFP